MRQDGRTLKQRLRQRLRQMDKITANVVNAADIWVTFGGLTALFILGLAVVLASRD